jgi:hypothetical protein
MMLEPIDFVVNAFCQVRVLVRYMTIYQTRETQTRRELSWGEGILGLINRWTNGRTKRVIEALCSRLKSGSFILGFIGSL